MIAAPAIYGDLGEAAAAAHAQWRAALFQRADHVMDCTYGGCGRFGACPTYAQLSATEQAAWRAWDAVRPVGAP